MRHSHQARRCTALAPVAAEPEAAQVAAPVLAEEERVEEGATVEEVVAAVAGAEVEWHSA